MNIFADILIFQKNIFGNKHLRVFVDGPGLWTKV